MARNKNRDTTYRLRSRASVWYIYYTDPHSGRTAGVSTRTGERAQAEIALDQFIAGREQPEALREPLVSEIVDGYLSDRKGRVAAYDTLQWAAAGIKRHIGNLAPGMLARRTYLNRRSKDGVSDGTIRRETGTLRAALAWAVREGAIEKAPYVEMPPMPPPRDRWLTREEFDRLVQGAATPHIRLFIVLAFHTAARMGAILDLTWDRVDFEHKRISYDKPGRQRSKKRRATVPINTAALAELQSARMVAISDHVIEFRGKPAASIKTGFRKACRRAGIADCSAHILRHSAATHLVMAGVPLSQIARYLGDSEAVVERVYGKHSPDYLRHAADALAGGISKTSLGREAS